MKTSKSKTFQKGDDFYEVINFFTQDGLFELDEIQPEGTDWSGGEPGPHDPQSLLKHKYIVYVVKVGEKEAKGPIDLICPECGGTFKSIKQGNYYCGQKCYQRAYKRKNKYEVAEKRLAYRQNKKAEEKRFCTEKKS